MILIQNPEIRTIYRRIRKLENRDAAESMARLGLQYEQNHGVMIADLAHLSVEYKGRMDLADEMRDIPVREMRLLAEMIDPHSERSELELSEIVMKIDTSELAEQFAVHFDKSVPNAKALATEWAEIKALYPASAGFNLLSFLSGQINDSDLERLFNTIENHPLCDEMQLQKYQARCLRKIAGISPQYKKKVLNFLQKLKKADAKFAILIEESEPFIHYMR